MLVLESLSLYLVFILCHLSEVRAEDRANASRMISSQNNEAKPK